MIRDGSLRRGARRGRRRKEAVDPMAGVANLSDVMLVLACGLMIAIITFWNVDLANVTDTFNEDQLQKVENPEEVLQDDTNSTKYEEAGVVIRDPETGQMYVVEK